MDIRNWPVDKIMQLPDECFGRRWLIMFSGYITTIAKEYYISEMALPDVCVLWELCFYMQPLSTGNVVVNSDYAIYLGDHLPTTDAEMALMEPMLPGADEIVDGLRVIRGPGHFAMVRQAYAAQGRRVVLRVRMVTNLAGPFVVSLVVSSLPTEIPDWLVRRTGHQGEKW